MSLTQDGNSLYFIAMQGSCICLCGLVPKKLYAWLWCWQSKTTSPGGTDEFSKTIEDLSVSIWKCSFFADPVLQLQCDSGNIQSNANKSQAGWKPGLWKMYSPLQTVSVSQIWKLFLRGIKVHKRCSQLLLLFNISFQTLLRVFKYSCKSKLSSNQHKWIKIKVQNCYRLNYIKNSINWIWTTRSVIHLLEN